MTHDGRDVGRFDEDEVYGPDGLRLGEVMSGDRLITSRAKKHGVARHFAPHGRRLRFRYLDYIGYLMYAGYEDFPKPEDLSLTLRG